MAYAFVGFGLILLIVGSESVLRGGVGLSKFAGLSPLLIGLLIVSAGTSAPELVVSLQAAVHEAPDLALGNIVGSNIVNILLILGLGAVLRPIPVSPKTVLRDGGALVAASIALFMLLERGIISHRSGWMLLAGFAAYVTVSFLTDWRRPSPDKDGEARADARDGREPSAAMSAILLLFGLACLYFGGGYVVDGSLAIARIFHVPQAIIGLTLVAIGSSLPELATTIGASIRGHTSIAAGNLIGANVFNILFVLGLTAVVHPMTVSRQMAGADIYVMMAAAALLPLMLASRWRLTRAQGVFLVLSYLVYLGFVALRLGLLPAAVPGAG